jgi:hypothetical protein
LENLFDLRVFEKEKKLSELSWTFIEFFISDVDVLLGHFIGISNKWTFIAVDDVLTTLKMFCSRYQFSKLSQLFFINVIFLSSSVLNPLHVSAKVRIKDQKSRKLYVKLWVEFAFRLCIKKASKPLVKIKSLKVQLKSL